MRFKLAKRKHGWHTSNEKCNQNGPLPAGKYYLIVKIGKDSKAIEINIKGFVSVANREAVSVDASGKRSELISFKSMAIPSTPLADGSPDIKQMVPLYIAAIVDPCANTNCTDPLELQFAKGSAYSLQVSSNKVMFYEKKNGKLVAFNPASNRTIGESGIDTIYVTIPADEMDSQEEKVSISVKGSARKAEINFFVPRFVFVEAYDTYNIITTDKDTDLLLSKCKLLRVPTIVCRSAILRPCSTP